MSDNGITLSRKNENRRRTGCWTCKKTHVQCKEERPTCSRCLRLNLDCEYGIRLLWREDAVQRNISLGREGKWSKNTKRPNSSRSEPGGLYRPISIDAYSGQWIFLNVTENDFNNKFAETCEMDNQTSTDGRDHEAVKSLALVAKSSPIIQDNDFDSNAEDTLSQPAPFFNTFSNFSLVEGILFSYFVSSICPNCSLSSSQNPYLTLLTPMSFQSPALNSALLAVSANQLRLLNDTRFEREAWYYKNKAIQGVQRGIDSGNVDLGVIATVLMLCFYDISDGCNRSWVTHLRGGLSLLDNLSKSSERNGGSMTGDDSLHTFLRMYFVAHDIMSRTAYEDDIAAHPSDWADDETLDEIDVLMGCSRELMNLIRQTSTLASQAKRALRSGATMDFEFAAIAKSRDSIERSLHSLHQILPKSTPLSSDLPLIAETKRLSALLYLHQRLPPPEYNTTTTTNRTHLTSSIISLINRLPNTPTLLWPLFILGNTTGLDECQRRFVLERLSALQKVRNLGSVKRARDVVERVWRGRDLDVQYRSGDLWKKDEMRDMISLA